MALFEEIRTIADGKRLGFVEESIKMLAHNLIESFGSRDVKILASWD